MTFRTLSGRMSGGWILPGTGEKEGASEVILSLVVFFPVPVKVKILTHLRPPESRC